MSENFLKYLEGIQNGLKVLGEDIGKIVANRTEKQKAELEERPPEKEHSMKSLQRVTTIYKSEKDLKETSEGDPDIRFVKEQLNTIFSE